MFEMLAKCESCGSSIDVNPNTIIKKEVTCVEDCSELSITYYDCEKCSRRHIVQVDNQETNKMLTEFTKLMAKASIVKKNNKQLKKKEITKINKIRSDLAEKRFLLMQKYQGKHYLDNGRELTFEVSMQDGRNLTK